MQGLSRARTVILTFQLALDTSMTALVVPILTS
jgi:hypothetical protein